MTMADLKDYLYQTVHGCFPGETVIWAEQYAPRPRPPMVTMKLKDLITPRFPANEVVDGETRSYYECTKILEVNRYTGGTCGDGGRLCGSADTAGDGLAGLLLYLQSDGASDRNFLMNVCIEQVGPARDIPSVDGTHYRNRAMQEFTVRFIMEYREGEASLHVPAAGTAPERGPAGFFENVEVEEKYE